MNWRPTKHYPGYLICSNQDVMTTCGRPVPVVVEDGIKYVTLFNHTIGKMEKLHLYKIYVESILGDEYKEDWFPLKMDRIVPESLKPIGFSNGKLIYPLELIYDRDNLVQDRR